MRNLGLIGGLGPGATVYYYEQLVKAQSGELLLIHADLDRVLHDVARENRTGLADYFARLIERLARGGAEIAAISAVTPHICIEELLKITPLPLVNIIEQLRQEIRSRGYGRITLFGTRFVVQSRLFGMLKEEVEVLVPEQVEAIHDAYMQIISGNQDSRATLSKIAHELPVDAIVLAGTDLSLVFNEDNTDFPHIDCTNVHLRAIWREIRRGFMPGSESVGTRIPHTKNE